MNKVNHLLASEFMILEMCKICPVFFVLCYISTIAPSSTLQISAALEQFSRFALLSQVFVVGE